MAAWLVMTRDWWVGRLILVAWRKLPMTTRSAEFYGLIRVLPHECLSRGALIPRSDHRHPTAGTEHKYCKQRDGVLLLTRFLRAQSADAVKAGRRIWIR